MLTELYFRRYKHFAENSKKYLEKFMKLINNFKIGKNAQSQPFKIFVHVKNIVLNRPRFAQKCNKNTQNLILYHLI